MATILTVLNSEGNRRCDAKCHHAESPDCDCICGGRYHGAGDRAEEQLRRDWLEGLLPAEVAAALPAGQLQLI